MPIPDSISLHPASAQFNGTIHFRGLYSYIQSPSQSSWSLLQFDMPFTGNLNFTIAAQTASRLKNSFNENDPISSTGVMMNVSSNGMALSVLFVDGIL